MCSGSEEKKIQKQIYFLTEKKVKFIHEFFIWNVKQQWKYKMSKKNFFCFNEWKFFFIRDRSLLISLSGVINCLWHQKNCFAAVIVTW